MPDRADDPQSAATPEVPFDTGCLGCLFLIMIAVVALFAISAFDRDFFAILANSDARRNPLPALSPFNFGGINIALLVLLVPIVWELVKLGRRFVDMKAVWIEDEMVRFHPTLRRKALPLSALDHVTHEAGEVKSVLVLREAGGAVIRVEMVDHAAAQAFVAEIDRLRARGGRP